MLDHEVPSTDQGKTVPYIAHLELEGNLFTSIEDTAL